MWYKVNFKEEHKFIINNLKGFIYILHWVHSTIWYDIICFMPVGYIAIEIKNPLSSCWSYFLSSDASINKQLRKNNKKFEHLFAIYKIPTNKLMHIYKKKIR